MPQGSVLGPLLFLIYINDISDLHLDGQLFLFADDTAIFYSSPSASTNCEMATSDLSIVNRFFDINHLPLNHEKTKVMHFRTQRSIPENISNISVQLNGEPIQTVSSFKYLGLMLDSNLTWQNHINLIASKIRPVVAIMYRAKQLLPLSVRKMLYSSMIQSHLRYMAELYGAASMSHLKIVQVLQNSAIRNLLNAPYLTPRELLYSNDVFPVLPIKGIYENALAVFVRKKLLGLTHSRTIFQTYDHGYASRNRSKLLKPKCKLTISQKRVSYAGAHVYNELPSHIHQSTTITSFNRNCASWLSNCATRYLQY